LIKACYINEFRPLAQTPEGRAAIGFGNLPPFIDASCRREPDLLSVFPSITALCREAYFAPCLHEGDVVAYMTKDFAYPANTQSARRLVAVLRIHRSWQTHPNAAEWYQERGLPLPGNCMVSGSQPLPLELTDRDNPNLRDWEAHYWKVVRAHGVFHACEPVFRDVIDPPRLQNRQLVEWFGKIPNTYEIEPLEPDAFAGMLDWLAVQTADSTRQRLEGLRELLLHRAFTGAP
jgi:hypothetical protein